MSASAYNSWGRVRISGYYNGTDSPATFGSQYGIYGGIEFVFDGSLYQDSEVEEALRWGIGSMSDGSGVFQFNVYNLVKLLDLRPSLTSCTFHVSLYVKGLGVDSALVYPCNYDEFGDHASAWSVICEMRKTSSSHVARLIWFDPNTGSTYWTSATVPKNTYYIYIGVQSNQYPACLTVNSRFWVRFQLVEMYKTLNTGESAYTGGFGTAISNFVSVLSPLFTNAPFLTLLGVFCGGCIVALVLKMGCNL